jgi:peptide/nickel transport system substrate-binding protein
MQRQTTMLDYKSRKRAYDRVQELVTTYDPVVCLVSPNVLVGAKASLAGIRPSVMRNSLLWDAEQLFWRSSGKEGRHADGRPPSH